MKKIFIILLLLPFSVFAQNWQWARQVGGNASESYDDGHVVTDGSNFYLYGTFSGTMFLQSDTFNSWGNSDFYMIKFDNNGNEIWAKAFGGYNGKNQFESIGIDYDSFSKSIYLSGSFFGTMNLDTFHLIANIYSNNFMAKMDLNGNFLWAKKVWIKNKYNLNGHDDGPILFLKAGLIYMTASVTDSAFFDSLTVPPGGCLAKFDSNGHCLWVKHLFNNTTLPFTNFVNVNFVNNDLILYGGFKQTFMIDTATLISNGNYDMFLSRADSLGHIKWIKHFGYGGIDGITWLSIDHSNNLYAAAAFSDSISIETTTFYNSIQDILLLKFDENGNFIWGRQTHASENPAYDNFIASDGDGKCYLTGHFYGSVTFGPNNISTNNTSEMFLAGYNSNGDCLGVKHFGKASSVSVVIDHSGNPVCAGDFSNTVSIGSNTFTSSGPFDIYLAKSDAFTDIGPEPILLNTSLIIYANPTTGKCDIKIPDEFQDEKNLILSIFDNTGKIIQQVPVLVNESKIKINLEAEAKGIYFATLSNGKKSYKGKIVFE